MTFSIYSIYFFLGLTDGGLKTARCKVPRGLTCDAGNRCPICNCRWASIFGNTSKFDGFFIPLKLHQFISMCIIMILEGRGHGLMCAPTWKMMAVAVSPRQATSSSLESRWPLAMHLANVHAQETNDGR